MTQEQARENARNMIEGLFHGISWLDDAERIVVQSALMRYYMDGDKEYAFALETFMLGREEKEVANG